MGGPCPGTRSGRLEPTSPDNKNARSSDDRPNPSPPYLYREIERSLLHETRALRSPTDNTSRLGTHRAAKTASVAPCRNTQNELKTPPWGPKGHMPRSRHMALSGEFAPTSLRTWVLCSRRHNLVDLLEKAFRAGRPPAMPHQCPAPDHSRKAGRKTIAMGPVRRIRTGPWVCAPSPIQATKPPTRGGGHALDARTAAAAAPAGAR